MKSQKKVLGFWKPKDKYGFMSQWYESDFTINNIKFNTCEKYMMYQKAVLFNDIENMNNILLLNDPSKIKKMGRKVKNFNQEKWDSVKKEIIYKGNLYKFSQNKNLLKKLLDTGDMILAETSPYDKIYGIGLKPNDLKIQYISQWKGENLLGEALMRVRENLRYNINPFIID